MVNTRPRAIVLHLLCVVILFYPLDLYRFEAAGLPLTISRVTLFISSVFFVLFVVAGAIRIKRSILNQLLIAFICILMVLDLILSGGARTLGFLMGCVFVLLAANSAETEADSLSLLRVFQLSYLWFIFFAIYSYWYFFSFKQPLTDIPFRTYIPFALKDPGHIARGFLVGAGPVSLPRLALPLSTPPVTSSALAIGLFLFLFDSTLKASRRKNLYRWTMISCLTGALLLTMSKTGFLTIVIILLGLAIRQIVYKRALSKSAGMMVAGLALVMTLLLSTSIGEPVARRLSDPHVMRNTVAGHLETRIEGLRVMFTSGDRFIFGVGPGNYGEYASTSHSHSSYVTMLVEFGVVGSAIFWSLFVFVLAYRSPGYKGFTKGINISDPRMTSVSFGLKACILTVLIGALFYEMVNEWPTYVLLGISSAWFTCKKDGYTILPGGS